MTLLANGSGMLRNVESLVNKERLRTYPGRTFEVWAAQGQPENP